MNAQQTIQKQPKLIDFAFSSLVIDEKRILNLLIQRSGISLLQSEVRWIEKLKNPSLKCDIFIDFNVDTKYFNTIGLGYKCNNNAEYRINYKSINNKIYSKKLCKECLKQAILNSFKNIFDKL